MNYIHSTAVLDPSVILGYNVRIGPFCYLGPNVIIGDNTNLVGYCSIGFNQSSCGVMIGANCTLKGITLIEGGQINPTIIGQYVHIENTYIGHDAIIHDCVKPILNRSIRENEELK